MDKRNRDILVRDSRSANMARRLLELAPNVKIRRQRWMLLGGNGTLVRLGPKQASS